MTLKVNRQRLYQSFNALGNLTEKAGTIDVTVDARAEAGFDPVWLRNAVLEPLEEADIEVERKGAGGDVTTLPNDPVNLSQEPQEEEP